MKEKVCLNQTYLKLAHQSNQKQRKNTVIKGKEVREQMS